MGSNKNLYLVIAAILVFGSCALIGMSADDGTGELQLEENQAYAPRELELPREQANHEEPGAERLARKKKKVSRRARRPKFKPENAPATQVLAQEPVAMRLPTPRECARDCCWLFVMCCCPQSCHCDRVLRN